VRSTAELRKKKLTKIDKNILKGVFVRKLKDFKENEEEKFQQMTLIERLTRNKVHSKEKKNSRRNLVSVFQQERDFREDSREDNNWIFKKSMNRDVSSDRGLQ